MSSISEIERTQQVAKFWMWRIQWMVRVALVIVFTIPQAISSVVEGGPFGPELSLTNQPKSFCPPIRDFDCSVYRKGTTWHFFNRTCGYCCFPIFIVNGTFRSCDENGQLDQWTECPNGSHNWRNPFHSSDFQWPDQAIDVCRDKGPIEDIALPHITWNSPEFITRVGTTATLQATVHSTTDLMLAHIFKNNATQPQGQMKINHIADTDEWLVVYQKRNPTKDDGGHYSVLATNKEGSRWSSKALLTVLQEDEKEHPTTQGAQTQVLTSQKPTEVIGGMETTDRIVLYCILGVLLFCIFCFGLWNLKRVCDTNSDNRTYSRQRMPKTN